MTCVKPFTIPDRWIENTFPDWDPGDTFERYDNHGVVLPNADVYNPPGTPNYSGYKPTRDKGLLMIIRASNDTNIESSMYFSWAMPPDNGGAWYEQNIAGCNATEVVRDMPIIQEPGNMVGPTGQGIDALIAQDPTAFWDDANKRVVSTMKPSPRVFPIPLYDPIYYAEGKKNGRFASFKVANWIGFFLESVAGNEIYGRMIPIAGIADSGKPTPDSANPIAIRLVG